MFIHFHRTDLTLLVFNNHSSHFSHPHVSKSWTSDGSDFGIGASVCLRHLRVSFPIKAIYKAFKVCCIEMRRHKHFWYVLSQNKQKDSLPYHRHIIPTEFKLKFFHLWVGHHKALNRNWQCSRDTFNTDLWQLPPTMSSSGLRRYPVSQPWNITHGFSNVLNLVPWV